MGLWWLLLITSSLAFGDLQNYDYFDPNDGENTKYSKIDFQRPEIDSLPRKRNFREDEQGKRQPRFHSWGGKRYDKHLTTGEDTDVGKSINEPDDQEEHFLTHDNSSLSTRVFVIDNSAFQPKDKRNNKKPAFSSWGGKRAFEDMIQKEKRSNYGPDFQPVEFKSRMNDQNKKRYPAFNSWAGKRSIKNNDWDEKRSNAFHSWAGKREAAFNNWGGMRNSAFESWGQKRKAAFNSWGGKRDPSFNNFGQKRKAAFNSWGGKRGAAFNSWGGKRAASFNSWGGKRGAAFNSWGGKRAAAFNSWGGKRGAAFNSWGGKRGAAFNSWGGKRAAAFNSWGGKRGITYDSLQDKRVSAFNSWGGKRFQRNEAFEGQEEKRFPELNCEPFLPICDRLEKTLNKEENVPCQAKFESKHMINAICAACICWNKPPIITQSFNEALREDIFNLLNSTDSRKVLLGQANKFGKNYFSHSLVQDLGPTEKTYERIVKDKDVDIVPYLSYIYQSLKPKDGKMLIPKKVFKPMDLITFFKCEGEDAISLNSKKQFCQEVSVGKSPLWEIPKGILKHSYGMSLTSLNSNEHGGNRGDEKYNPAESLINKAYPNYKDENKEINLGYPFKWFNMIWDTKEDNTKVPYNRIYKTSETNKYENQKPNNNDLVCKECNSYLTDIKDENSQDKEITNQKHLEDYKYRNLFDKRSTLFQSWYDNKLPSVQLSNGKRKPAFSSWGGKRSENKAFEADSDCESSNDEKECINRNGNITVNPESGYSFENGRIMERENAIESSDKMFDTGGLTYGERVNRDKRSTTNIKKNKDIAKIILQGGFAWPMIVKSFSRGVDFYAWGGKRSL